MEDVRDVWEAVFENGDIVVKEGDLAKLKERGYGDFADGVFKLSPLGAFFLADRGKLKILKNGRCLGLSEIAKLLAECDKNFWIKYLVYSDLRKKGFIVIEGFRDEPELLIKRREDGFFKTIVRILVEGARVGFRELSSILGQAMRTGKDVIICIVDKEGNTSYYQIFKLS